MVLLSNTYLRTQSKSDISICSKRSVTSTESSNSLEKTYLLHTCETCSEQPYNISTMYNTYIKYTETLELHFYWVTCSIFNILK